MLCDVNVIDCNIFCSALFSTWLLEYLVFPHSFHSIDSGDKYGVSPFVLLLCRCLNTLLLAGAIFFYYALPMWKCTAVLKKKSSMWWCSTFS